MSDAVGGKDGKVLFAGAGGEVLEIRNWSIDRNMRPINTTSMSSGGNDEFKLGMKGWSGSFETVKYYNLHASVGLGSFYVGAGATGSTPIFAGTILISNAPASVNYDDTVAYSHSFTGSGPCTATVA